MLLRGLATHTRPLWREGSLQTAVAGLDAALRSALQGARSAGQVVRGLEAAQDALAAETRGLALVDARTDAPRGVRVSRLLLLANDGAERFYRQVESLLHREGPRVLAIRLETDADTLGALVFGPDRLARLLLLSRKESVSAALLALAEQWQETDPG